MSKYAIYGAGAFGQEAFLIVQEIAKKNTWNWDFEGFIDDGLPIGTTTKYGKVIGNSDYINNYPDELQLILAIGNPKTLQAVYHKINNPQIQFPNIIHPSVMYMGDKASMGKGNIISALGLISFDVKIGDFNVFNTRASLGHHVEIGSFNVFHPNVQLSGNVKIGNQNSFGFNFGVIPGKKIGNENVFAPGSVIIKNISDSGLYIGNPAQKIKL